MELQNGRDGLGESVITRENFDKPDFEAVLESESRLLMNYLFH